MSPRAISRRPAGFTLIELLVVISIIAILMALTTAAVQKVRDVGNRTKATVEIRQLDTALNTFMQKMSVREIACRGSIDTTTYYFRLCRDYANDGGIDRRQSKEYQTLKQLFPNAALASTDDGWQASMSTDGIGNGLPTGVELDPSHLLVFWLGGYYRDTTVADPIGQVFGQGFNSDARFPFRSNGAPAAKKGAFFDFPAGRLSLVNNRVVSPTVTIGGVCPRFMDPFGSPYCFFATENGRDNSYSPLSHFDWDNGDGNGNGISRIVPLAFGVPPTSTLKYANPKTIQIFSAGKNRLFPFAITAVGPQLWTPNASYFTDSGSPLNGGQPAAGGDDFSNFAPSVMSVSP